MGATTYEIKKKITGGYSVSYNCPHCSDALVSNLKEAGASQNCPTCQRPLVVPGKGELAELERKAALALEEKKVREAQRAEEKKTREAEKKLAAVEAAKAKK